MSPSQYISQDARKVIIVGAGLTGLAAAKTYLEINPAMI
jgi:monoamine oxidase